MSFLIRSFTSGKSCLESIVACPHFCFFSTTSDFTLRALPPLSEDYRKQAEKITAAFLGDPSYFAYNGEDPEPEDPDAPPVERFREVNRLTYVVNVSECFDDKDTEIIDCV